MALKRTLSLGLALIALANCSRIVADVDVPGPAGAVDDRTLIASYFRALFTDYAFYRGYEISNPRMVDSMLGRTSVTCLRFQANGVRRTYVFFIKNNKIVSARYDVQTDGCGAQSYAPFVMLTGSENLSFPAAQHPIY
jgi:hypothetical protein